MNSSHDNSFPLELARVDRTNGSSYKLEPTKRFGLCGEAALPPVQPGTAYSIFIKIILAAHGTEPY